MASTVINTNTVADEQFIPARRYVSQDDVARYLGISVSSVRRAVAAGNLTVYRFGGRIMRLDLNEVDAKMVPSK